MKAKKMLALLLSGAMALTVGIMAACNNNNNPGGNNPDDPNKDNPDDPPVVGGGDYDYTLDNTEYYIVGNGEGSLKPVGFNETDHTLTMLRDETADHNKFDLTIDLYAGDAFQIVHDDSWTGQMGITYVQGVDEENNVKDEEGNVVFSGAGTFGTDIELQAGHDGVYTISLHTFPDGEKDAYITYTMDEELSALLDMYVVGDMNNFGFSQNSYRKSHMTKNGSIWQFILEIKEEDVCRNELGEKVEGGEYYAVAVRNDVEDADGEKVVTSDSNQLRYFNDEYGYEYNLLKAGAYTLKYDAEKGTLTIIEGATELYFTGSFNDGTASDEYKLTEDADGNWYGYITLEEAATVSLYNKYTEATYDVNEGAQLEAGEYFVKFTLEDKSVAHEALAYYIAGTVTGAEWGVGATSPKLDWDEENGVYYIELIDTAGGEFKVLYGTRLGGGKGDAYWYSDETGGNILLAAGDYLITFNPATKLVKVEEAESEVTVSFDLNYPEGVEGPEGQEAPASQTINKRQTATEPTEELTLDDYTFLGWYTDKECTDKFEFSTPVTSDMTLYAGWILTSEIPATPKITFNWNDGTGKTEVVETVDGLIGENMPAEPERNGYWFLGWYTSSAGTTEFNFSNPITNDTTVHAKWLQIDTHKWHIVGTNISGIESWNPADTGLSFTHDDELYPKQNVFTLTVTLTDSASFKILGVTGWSQGYEVGAGSIVGGNGELGGSGDITVNKTGVYTLILSTENNGLTVKLTYTFTPLVLENDIYFNVNGVDGAQLNSDGNGTWTGSITVKAGDVIKLVDKKNNNKEYPVNITVAGDYFVKLVVSTEVVTVEEYGYYLAGGFAGADWGIIETSPKMTWDASAGVYTYELVATAGLQFKVVYGYLGFVKDWISNADGNNLFTWASDGNLIITNAGTYTITYNPTTGKIGVAKK